MQEKVIIIFVYLFNCANANICYMMFIISKAKLTLSLKQIDMFISAFPQNIVFGLVKNDEYKVNQSFQIPFFQIQFWYLAIVDIIRAYTGETDVTKNLILSVEPHIHYSWFFLESRNICFAIEVQGDVTFKSHFTILEFNNWILTLNNLILHTLCLKPQEFFAFEQAACLPIEKILKLKEKDELKTFLLNIFSETIDFSIQIQCEVLLIYYLEIIVLKHKLNSLYNPFENLSDKVIKMITS